MNATEAFVQTAKNYVASKSEKINMNESNTAKSYLTLILYFNIHGATVKNALCAHGA